MATQQCAALDAVLANKDWAQLVLRPLLVTDATWSVTDAAKALARVERVCRALRRAVEPLWWRTLVVQRWPSAALVMPQRPTVAAPPDAGAWRMLFRQRHIAALGAPPINAPRSAAPSLCGFDFSVELTLDGQPFASALLPGMTALTAPGRPLVFNSCFRSDDLLLHATAATTGALMRTSSEAAPRLRATLFAHRPCQPADPRRAGSNNRGTSFACVLNDAAAVQPADMGDVLDGLRHEFSRTATTVAFELPLRRNDSIHHDRHEQGVLQLVLLLSLHKPPAAAPGGAGTVQGDVAAAAAADGDGDDALELRHVSLHFVNRVPRGTTPNARHVYGHNGPPHPDSVYAALASLRWEGEVLPPRWERRQRPYWAL
jgi:hypothetical protein